MLYLNNGNLMFQSNGVAVAGIQFTVPSTTGLALSSTVAATKFMQCGPNICVIVGNNVTNIPDGPLVNLAALPTAVIAVSPTGDSVAVNVSTNPCDINKDGVIDSTDLSAIAHLASGSTIGSADINGDGKTDILDVFRVIIAIATGSCKVGP